MPPKRRQYRKPKTEKPVFFGPERPPPPETPASAAPPSTSSGVRQETPTAQGGWEGAQADAPPSQQDASTAPAPQEGEGEAMTAEIGGKGNKRRRKIPRKKWGKETKGGWDADDELPPHEQDEGRYDPSLPYDLRLLRCCDEFRSLRSFRDKDIRVNYNTLLRFFQADILTLRASYGSQILRGYDPEADLEDEDAAGEGEEDDGEGSDAAEDPLQDKKVSLEGKTEEEWAGYVFDPGRLVKFFDNRFNDGYTPTLTLAPKIAGSFLKFQLARNVFPDYVEGIKACIDVCDTASKQLLPASILLKQLKNHDGLASNVSRLFRTPSPSTTDTGAKDNENDVVFSLPVPYKPDPALLASEEPADAVHSVYDISQKELTEIEALSEQVEPEPVKDWAEWKKREGGGGGRRGKGGATKDTEKDGSAKATEQKKEEKGEKSDEDTAHLNRLKKQFELDASSRRKWTSRARSDASAASQLAESTKRLDFVGEGDEGAWMLGRRERSARTLKGWELLAGTPVPPEPRGGGGRQEKGKGKEAEKTKKHAEGDDRLLVKLSFGKHEDAFPLTTNEHALPPSTVEAIGKANLPAAAEEHNLSSPLSVIVDLPPFFNLDHLSTLHHTLFEADFTQLVFVPSRSNPDSTSSTSTTPTALRSLWVFSSLHRIIPPYWTHTTELLREEPREAERADWSKTQGEGEEDGDEEEGAEGENVWMREMRERWRVEEEESAAALVDGGVAPVREEKQKEKEEEGKEVNGAGEEEKPAARAKGAREEDTA